MSSIKKNIIANLLGKGWAMISAFIFIPIYIDILDLKLFGIIGFYSVLQGALIFADAGLTSTLRREMSLGTNDLSAHKRKYKVFRSVEFIYFFIVVLIASTIFFGADYLATKWLKIEDLDPIMVRNALRLMGAALAFNFLSSLYQGAILGLEKQVISNTYKILWGLTKNGGVIFALLLIERTLFVFFLWQLAVNILYVLILRIYILKQIRKEHLLSWVLSKDIRILKDIWKYALGMFSIALIASLNNQLDKIVISNSIEVSDFAVYTVAFTLSLIPVVISGPIAIAVFPRLTKYFSVNNSGALNKVFNDAFKLVLILTTICGIVLALNSELFLKLWTQDTKLAIDATPPAVMLLIGQTLLSYQVIPFNLLLARGNTKVNVIFGVIGIIILIPLLLVMVENFGMNGAAATWVLYYSLLTPSYLFYVIRKTTDFRIGPWVFNNIFKPISMVLIGCILMQYISIVLNLNSFFTLLFIGLSSILIFVLVFKFSFDVKGFDIISYIRKDLFTLDNTHSNEM